MSGRRGGGAASPWGPSRLRSFFLVFPLTPLDLGRVSLTVYTGSPDTAHIFILGSYSVSLLASSASSLV